MRWPFGSLTTYPSEPRWHETADEVAGVEGEEAAERDEVDLLEVGGVLCHGRRAGQDHGEDGQGYEEAEPDVEELHLNLQIGRIDVYTSLIMAFIFTYI